MTKLFRQTYFVLCDESKFIENNIAYMTDLFTRLYEVNFQIQGYVVKFCHIKTSPLHVSAQVTAIQM